MPMFLNLIIDTIKIRWRIIITQLVMNICFTLLIYLGLFRMLTAYIPRMMFFNADAFIFSGMMTLMTAVMAFIVASLQIRKSIRYTGTMDQIRSTYLRYRQIYFAQTLGFLVKTMIHVVVSAGLLNILMATPLNLGYFALFLIFQIFVALVFTQLGIIAGGFIVNNELYALLLFFIIIPLFLCSGALVPVTSVPVYIKDVITWLPTTVMVDGGRYLLLEHEFCGSCLGYTCGLAVFLSLLGYFLMRRKLTR